MSNLSKYGSVQPIILMHDKTAVIGTKIEILAQI